MFNTIRIIPETNNGDSSTTIHLERYVTIEQAAMLLHVQHNYNVLDGTATTLKLEHCGAILIASLS